MSEKFTFFWNGPFSQWEPSIFTIDDIEYNCAEQYMMAEKARLFKDEEMLENIMESDSPKMQKKYGRLVNDFDPDVWYEDEENGRPKAWNIVWRANMAKFSQNPHLLEDLLETEGTTLVEASPHDKIWGIGLRENDPRAKTREGWPGENWLGEVLTTVRSFLQVNQSTYSLTTDQRQPV